MLNNLRTFVNIFQGKDAVSEIIIPKIQRDYAQGRNTEEIRRIRFGFLDALYKAVTTGNKIKLDFIYGELDNNGILTPLDGQQRLTTLFLLHWYAAKKEKISTDKVEFLNKFSYDTRPDSREFCKLLVGCEVNFDTENLSAEIENLKAFPLGWKKDPTVSSMLVMIDAIHQKFHAVENLWTKLENDAISFYFLPVEKMGVTDEIYVTMNSRGKPLTDFEHFKAEFKRRLDEIDRKISDRIILKIDTKWTDLLWDYRDENNLVDNGFLAYFRFLCDIILYRKGSTPQGKSREPFDLLEEFFGDDIKENIDFMEKSFDCWCDFSNELAQTNETISKFFRDRVSIGSRNDKTVNKHIQGKIITYSNDPDFHGDFFDDCLKSHGKGLSLGKTIMLYAFLVYVLNRQNISDVDFRRRIRIVNNLVINSGNAELSNSEARNNGNRIPAMLEQVDNIIIDEKILNNDEIKTRNKYNFNENQLQEEREKLQWTKINQDRAEELFELEDHYLLYGQISIVGLEHPEYFKRFISLFDCDYDKINCALLALGDYRQTDKYGQIYQLGARKPVAWQNLFHKTLTNKRFDDTKNILEKLLTTACIFTDNHLQKIINDYLGDCESKSEFKWMYYYIKYEDFRPQDCYGRYRWECFAEKPYSFLSLSAERRRSTRSYQPFLKAAKTKGTLSVDDFGMRLIFEKYYVEATNFGYVCKDIDTNKKIDELSISQQNGIDTEDRIKAFETFIKSLPY